MALDQLDGRLSRKLSGFRAELIELVALLEGNIDFSEEQHYEFTNREDALRRLDRLVGQVRELLGTFERGRMIRMGTRWLLSGGPMLVSPVYSMLYWEKTVRSSRPHRARPGLPPGAHSAGQLFGKHSGYSRHSSGQGRDRTGRHSS